MHQHEAQVAFRLLSRKNTMSIASQVKTILKEAETTMINGSINRLTALPIQDKQHLEEMARTLLQAVVMDELDILEDGSKHARCGEVYADIAVGVRRLLPTFEQTGEKT